MNRNENDEMYAIEFHPCELTEEGPDDMDTDPACPMGCSGETIAYAMRYSDGPGDDDCEWAQCRKCGWDGPAEDIERQPAIHTLIPRLAALKPIAAKVRPATLPEVA